MTRAEDALMFPPSPMNPWAKFPEFLTNVESPSPKLAKSMVTPGQAERITVLVRPRSSTTRSVSEEDAEFCAPISQNRCPNAEAGFWVMRSIRRVPRPENGEELESVGVVEYRAYTPVGPHAVPPEGRQMAATYWGRSETS